MGKIKEFFRVIGELRYIIPLLRYQWPKPDDVVSLAKSFESSTDKYSDRTFMYFEDQVWSYKQTNERANAVATYLRDAGIKHSDKVVVFMENRPEYIISLLALNKLGAVGVLINTSLTGDPLIHCINSSDSIKCIFGDELKDSLEDVLDQIIIKDKENLLWVKDNVENKNPEWSVDLNSKINPDNISNLEETNSVTAKDTAFYIFTSGTTGVPKAAIFPNVKIVAASVNITKGGYRMDHNDCLYNCLPLYHSTGLMLGVCATVHVGASTFIRRKFSASSFWQEAQKFNTTAFIYVGELCRYLAIQDPCPEEKNNPIQKMVGNGLRPDLWDDFRNRFKVERIVEIYGASEGNAMMMNILNKDKTIGMANARIALIEYDVAQDEIIEDENGKYIEIKDDRAGLLINEIGPNAVFNGYTDAQASEKKILRNVFEEGDAWFNTGDLIKTVDVGFALGKTHYQFVDRIGDTFRWRSENVSTNEVGEILNGSKFINMANVYGVKVPGCEGRAGMVAFVSENKSSIDWDQLSEYVNTSLPKYARPVFVRIIEEMDTTGTFKMKKNVLRDESYHIDKHADDIFVMMPNSDKYEKLTEEKYNQISSGQAGF